MPARIRLRELTPEERHGLEAAGPLPHRPGPPRSSGPGSSWPPPRADRAGDIAARAGRLAAHRLRPGSAGSTTGGSPAWRTGPAPGRPPTYTAEQGPRSSPPP